VFVNDLTDCSSALMPLVGTCWVIETVEM